jgi:hypothetical protein
VAATHPLDNPARAALLGPQAHLAERCGAVLRYAAGISPFVGLPEEPDPGDWTDLAKLIGAGEVAATAGVPATPPPGWQVLMNLAAVQLTGELVAIAPDAEAVPLGPADVPRCWTWWSELSQGRSCREPLSSAATSASVVTARW